MKNNKGFLLAETIITVSVIATLATSVYIYVSKTANRYEERNNYDQVVDVYKLNTVKVYLDKTIKDNVSNSDKTSILPTNLKSELNLQQLYIIKADNNSLNTLKNSSSITKQSLKDYLKYVVVDDSQIDVNNDYRIIGMFQENSDATPTFANVIITIR